MIAVLVRVISFIVTTVSNLLSRAIFLFIAQFLVFLIHTFRVPREATKGMLDQVAEMIKSVLAFAMELIMDVVTTIISKMFELIKDGIVESIGSTSGSIADLMEKTRDSLQGLVSDIPEALEGFSEMVTTMVKDLWNNYMEATGYVKDNA